MLNDYIIKYSIVAKKIFPSSLILKKGFGPYKALQDLMNASHKFG